MTSWYCCRTCLGTNSLHPISSVLNLRESLTEAAGFQINLENELPKQICTKCLNFVKKIMKFQKMCKESQRVLLKQLKCEESSKGILKIEPDTGQDVECQSFDTDMDNRDFFDTSCVAKESEKDNIIKFESTVENILKKRLNFDFENHSSRLKSGLKRKNITIKPEHKADLKRTDLVKHNDTEMTKETLNIENTFQCRHCSKVLKNQNSYRAHIKKHNVKLMCEHCGMQFVCKRRLLHHYKAKHGYEKTDKCSYCGWLGNCSDAVKVHERIHTGEKPYVCHECGDAFRRRSTYMQHLPIHLPEKTVQCDKCPALFKSKGLMQVHRARHKPPTHRHKCLVCGGSFAKRGDCFKHLKRIHGLTECHTMHKRLPIDMLDTDTSIAPQAADTPKTSV